VTCALLQVALRILYEFSELVADGYVDVEFELRGE
jgi:hypothetical protein